MTATVVRLRSLLTLASDIDREHGLTSSAFHDALAHAMRCGEMLLEAKASVRHEGGSWLEWLKASTHVPERTVQLYMRLAKHRPQIEAEAQRVADFSIREAVKLLAGPHEAIERDQSCLYDIERWKSLSNRERTRIIEDGIALTDHTFNRQTNASIGWAPWSFNPMTGCLHDCPSA